MLDSISILRLYANALHNDMLVNRIIPENVRAGVRNMAHVYAPDNSSFDNDSSVRQFSNFNDAGFRCAYLHKYAPLHTYIVIDVMLRILQEDLALFQKIISSGQFKFCCLGGGPGSDAIGVLAALHTVFNSFKSTVTIVDSMEKWDATFASLIRELRFGEYGPCWKNLSDKLQWSYIGADLLCSMSDEVNTSVGSASLVTMVKFISAATCKDTESMVEKIFRVMKPGALVLFIDNAAGGFTQLIERVGKKYNFRLKFGPHRHQQYENEDLKIERFGFTSCFKTTVTVILLQKPYNQHQTKKQACSRPNASNHNTAHVKKPLVPTQNFNQPSVQKIDINKSLFPNDSNARSAGKSLFPNDSRARSAGKSLQPNSSVTSAGKSLQPNKSNIRSAGKSLFPNDSRDISAGKSLQANNSNVTSAGKSLQPNNRNVTSAGKSLQPNNSNITSAGKSLFPNDSRARSAGKSLQPNNRNVTSAGKSQQPNNSNIKFSGNSLLPNSNPRFGKPLASSTAMHAQHSNIYSQVGNENIVGSPRSSQYRTSDQPNLKKDNINRSLQNSNRVSSTSHAFRDSVRDTADSNLFSSSSDSEKEDDAADGCCTCCVIS